MNSKNRIVFVFCLSFLILILWPRFVQKFFPQYSSAQISSEQQERTPSSIEVIEPAVQTDVTYNENVMVDAIRKRDEESPSFSVETSTVEPITQENSSLDEFIVVPIEEGLALEVSEQTGQLISLRYDREKVESFFQGNRIPLFLEVSGVEQFDSIPFNIQKNKNNLILTKKLNGVVWEKRYSWGEDKSTFVFSESFYNGSQEKFVSEKELSFILMGGELRPQRPGKTWVYTFEEQTDGLLYWLSGASFSWFGSPRYREDIVLENDNKWFAQVDKFFVYRVLPEQSYSVSDLRFIKTEVTVGNKTKKTDLGYVLLKMDPIHLSPGQKSKVSFKVDLLPKVRSVLVQRDKELVGLSSYPLNILTQPTLWLIALFFRLFNGYYILALIVVTLLFKLIVFPLNYKGMKSMQELKELTPKITAINQKYSRDPQAKMIALKELYSQHNVQPGGGCLYMLVPLPFFFAFFYALQNDFLSRGQAFLWVPDLSSPDPLKILPILVGFSWYFLQKFTQNNSTAQMGGVGGQQQRMLMILSPVLMSFFALSLPASLSVNWIVSNTLTVGLNYWIKKREDRKKGQVEVVDPKRKIKF